MCGLWRHHSETENSLRVSGQQLCMFSRTLDPFSGKLFDPEPPAQPPVACGVQRSSHWCRPHRRRLCRLPGAGARSRGPEVATWQRVGSYGAPLSAENNMRASSHRPPAFRASVTLPMPSSRMRDLRHMRPNVRDTTSICGTRGLQALGIEVGWNWTLEQVTWPMAYMRGGPRRM